MPEDKRQDPLPFPKEELLLFFEFGYLPDRIQRISELFHDLAHQLVNEMSRNPERTVCLRKLLESRDAAIRTIIRSEQ